MGKRKRSRSRDKEYENILKKVRKLEEKLSKCQRRTSTSSSEHSVHTGDVQVDVDVHQSEFVQSPLRDMDTDIDISNDIVPADESHVEPGLDPNILEILGVDPANENTYGENLHKDIALRWQHILLNGLPKENKTELMKSYLIPENCSNMKAPKLNLEIKAALSENNLRKDNFSENKQNQLSSGIAAIGKALNIALSPCNAPVSQELVKYLSDAGRLMCDYHYRESQSRRYAIINTLNKQTRDTIKNSKLDEYLFGSELSEHLKSSKAIAKSGSELRPIYTTRPQSKVVVATTAQPQRGALNYRGASRPAASETRPHPAYRRPAPAPSAPTARDRRHDPTSRSTYQRHRGRGR